MNEENRTLINPSSGCVENVGERPAVSLEHGSATGRRFGSARQPTPIACRADAAVHRRLS